MIVKDESNTDKANSEVLRTIEQTARDEVEELDLSDMKLTELPAEIGQITNLTQLNLSRNSLSSLPPEIGQLTNLT